MCTEPLWIFSRRRYERVGGRCIWGGKIPQRADPPKIWVRNELKFLGIDLIVMLHLRSLDILREEFQFFYPNSEDPTQGNEIKTSQDLWMLPMKSHYCQVSKLKCTEVFKCHECQLWQVSRNALFALQCCTFCGFVSAVTLPSVIRSVSRPGSIELAARAANTQF